MADLVPLETHLAEVLAAATPLPVRSVSLDAARGSVLARDVRTAWSLPPDDNSAMDGYAARRDDVSGAPVRLRVVADVPAGSALDPPIGPGECARIMTGAPVPSDADAIVPLEATDLGTGRTERLDEHVTILTPPNPGAHIRRRGEDAAAGDLVLAAGRVLGPRELSACASAGVARVEVVAPPRVAIVSTGSELVSVEEAAVGGASAHGLGRGRIVDSNGILLAGLVAEAGAEVVVRTRVADDRDAFTALVRELGVLDADTERSRTSGEPERPGRSSDEVTTNAPNRPVDVVVVTGGASVGAFDVARLVLEPAGIGFRGVAMQPGKPQGFGVAPSGVLVFSLPGNPVSVFASFEAFVRPALRRLRGERGPVRRTSEHVAVSGWRCPPGRAQLMPVRFVPGGVEPATDRGSGSHLVARLAAAEALAHVPADTDEVRVGDLVTCWELT